MPREVLANEPTASRRRVYFQLVDATDFATPETGEAGGQPQISTDGATWTDTGIGVLVAIGNGRYYADPTQAAVLTAGTVIETRYKSANTAECPGDTIHVVAYNPHDVVRMGLTALPNAVAGASGGLPTGDGSGRVAVQYGTSTGQVNLSAGDLAGAVPSVTNDIGGKVLGGGSGTITGTGVRAVDSSGNAIAPASTALTAASVATAILGAFGVTGTVDDGSAAAGSFIGDSGLSSTDDFYTGSVLAFTGGSLDGIARKVTGYTGATRTFAFANAFPSAPANTDPFVILGRID